MAVNSDRRRLHGLILGLLAPLAAGANTIEATLHGGIKNESAWFVAGESRWDKIQNRLELKPEIVVGDWQFRGRVLSWYDAAMDLEPTRAPDLTPAIKRHYRTVTQVKEAYLLHEGEAVDVRLGIQQIVWGKTDGLRMLDIVNPLDMREFILDDFLDSRIGVAAARFDWYPDSDIEQEVEFVLVPDARPAEAAPAGSRWAFARPRLPPGIVLRTLPGVEPGWSLKDPEYGAAWRATLGEWDVSLNYFHGWKDTPNAFRRLLPGVMELRLEHLRMHTIGGAFARASGPFVLRGEGAVNLREGIDSEGTSFDDTVERRTTVNAAIGLEWTRYNWTVNPQFFIRRIQNWEDRLAEDRTSGFWTLRIATDYMNEKLKPDLLIIADWDQGGWLARPRVDYEWSDHLVTSVGLDVFGGGKGFIGQFDANDRAYVEAELTF